MVWVGGGDGVVRGGMGVWMGEGIPMGDNVSVGERSVGKGVQVGDGAGKGWVGTAQPSSDTAKISNNNRFTAMIISGGWKDARCKGFWRG